MYCSNCGKFIDYDAKLCKECEAEFMAPQAPVDEGAKDTETPPVTDSTIPTTDQVPPYDGGMPPYGYYYNPNFYQPPTNPYAYSTEPEPQNRMFGFGKALASTILGFFSYFFSVLSMALLAEELSLAAGGIILLIAIGLTATSFIFGLQSIKCFQKRKATCAKPIAALILGIVGISFSGLSIFILSIAILLFFVSIPM